MHSSFTILDASITDSFQSRFPDLASHRGSRLNGQYSVCNQDFSQSLFQDILPRSVVACLVYPLDIFVTLNPTKMHSSFTILDASFIDKLSFL